MQTHPTDQRFRQQTVVAVGSVVIIVLFGLWWYQSPRGDTIRMRRLLEQLTPSYGPDAPPSERVFTTANNEAMRELGQFGAKALPMLLRRVEVACSTNWTVARRLSARFQSPDARRDAQMKEFTRMHRAFAVLGDAAAPAIPKLKEQLPSERTTTWVVAWLVAIGPAARPVLEDGARHPLEHVRRHCSDALDRLHTTRSVSHLDFLQFLGSDKPQVRDAAIALTLKRATTDAVVIRDLVPILISGNGRAKLAAAGIIESAALTSLSKGQPVPLEIVQAFRGALADPDSEVRAFAAFVLGEFRDSAMPAIPSLKAALNDPDERVRSAATNALRQLKVP